MNIFVVLMVTVLIKKFVGRGGRMRTLFSILIIVTLICFSAQGPVSASTLDTKGTEAAISCNSTPFLESHSINADGKTTFIFHHSCPK